MIQAHSMSALYDELTKIAVGLSGFTKIKPPTGSMAGGLVSNYSKLNAVPKAPNFGPNLSTPPLRR